MENLKIAEESIKKVVIALETRINELNEVIKLLRQESNIPVEIKAKDVSIVSEVTDDASLKEKFRNYPVDGKQRDKVRFILSTYGRAISDSEFETIIKMMEGAKADKTLEVLQRTIRGMTHPKFGEILQYNYSGNGIRFYIKPEWRGQDKLTVIKENAPVPNSFNLLDKNVLSNAVCVFKTVE